MNELELRAENENHVWGNNPVLTQLLGLSPVLAVSSNLTYGIALGIATFLVCVFSCLSASLLQNLIPSRWRLIWFMLILASYTTVIEIISQLYFYPLSLRLGLYIPLISCNVALLIRMETISAKSSWTVAVADGAKTGCGFLIALILLSACRELLISTTLFANWQLLLPTASELGIRANNPADAQFFRFAGTQAGALILLGLLIALLNFLSQLSKNRVESKTEDVVPVKRARVTGRLSRE
ncbi:MAG: hypothetical protein DHS20C12_09600 [Pseudohongiella sp.]|nr:MAG: hypothetical protein DHS20C12_09600 [Pseudohongiella sp.]